MRWALLAAATAGLLWAAWAYGAITAIWDADPTYLTSGIFGCFLIAFTALGLGYHTLFTFIGQRLVYLGLIGTVLGFVIALSGVDPERAGDIAAVGPMVGKLVEGLGVALYTTLVGAVATLWLDLCELVHGTPRRRRIS